MSKISYIIIDFYRYVKHCNICAASKSSNFSNSWSLLDIIGFYLRSKSEICLYLLQLTGSPTIAKYMKCLENHLLLINGTLDIMPRLIIENAVIDQLSVVSGFIFLITIETGIPTIVKSLKSNSAQQDVTGYLLDCTCEIFIYLQVSFLFFFDQIKYNFLILISVTKMSFIDIS